MPGVIEVHTDGKNGTVLKSRGVSLSTHLPIIDIRTKKPISAEYATYILVEGFPPEEEWVKHEISDSGSEYVTTAKGRYRRSSHWSIIVGPDEKVDYAKVSYIKYSKIVLRIPNKDRWVIIRRDLDRCKVPGGGPKREALLKTFIGFNAHGDSEQAGVKLFTATMWTYYTQMYAVIHKMLKPAAAEEITGRRWELAAWLHLADFQQQDIVFALHLYLAEATGYTEIFVLQDKYAQLCFELDNSQKEKWMTGALQWYGQSIKERNAYAKELRQLIIDTEKKIQKRDELLFVDNLFKPVSKKDKKKADKKAKNGASPEIEQLIDFLKEKWK